MGKRILFLLVSLILVPTAWGQETVLKTNLLYDATSTINLGVEHGLSDKWTLDISANYNPWKFGGYRQIKHWLIQPEVRYWLDERFNKHFFGFHLYDGQFNVSNPKWFDDRYQGWFLGAGLSYGYHWKWSERWSMDFTLGLGYAYLDYDKYPCASCGEKLKEGTHHYFGPTKAGISLIYILK